MKKKLLSIILFFVISSALIGIKAQGRHIYPKEPAKIKLDTYEKGKIEKIVIQLFYDFERIEDIFQSDKNIPKSSYTGMYKDDLEAYYFNLKNWLEENKLLYPNVYEELAK